jgi:glycerol-3-phosphate dehydrogenase subunit B
MKEGLAQWILDHPEHPYGKVGLERIETALSSFSSYFPPPYSFQARDERNSFIPTGAGTFRPTYLLPSTMMRGGAFKEKETLIIGFKGYKDFYVQRLADSFKCRGMTLSLSETPHEEVTANALVRRMEQPSFRETLSAEIKKQIRGETLLGLPAVLGMSDPMSVRKDLEKRIGVSIFEIPVLPPSIPGIRVFNRFKARLIQKGVTFLLGYSVSKAVLSGKRCDRIEVSHPPLLKTYSADQYILATGRFIGGGLKGTHERIIEPLFDLPVCQPPSRNEWFQETFFNDQGHLIHRSGILTDPFFRPVNESGEVLLDNVRIAGTILAHHNCIDEKSREGIEIATGYLAARMALGQ